MVTLYEDGLRKVVEGVTSLEEVLRVTHDQSDAESELPREALETDISTAEQITA